MRTAPAGGESGRRGIGNAPLAWAIFPTAAVDSAGNSTIAARPAPGQAPDSDRDPAGGAAGAAAAPAGARSGPSQAAAAGLADAKGTINVE